MAISAIREGHPRLYHPADDPEYAFAPPKDPVRRRIIRNMVADCETYASVRPWRRIPERFDSPHPFHQLYITFYVGMQATALIEHYAFAWRVTGDERWFKLARSWLLAASRWEHSDRVEQHFYTANRYMQAFALGLDLLWDRLTQGQIDEVTACLLKLMTRWWPDVDAQRHSKDGRHHAVVDNGHFGVAALYLLGKCPEASAWVEAVIDRFQSGIMPHGCGRDGEPGDGPSFWPWENLWMLQFADALRNVTGIDLYRAYPNRLSRPLIWFRHHLAAPGRIEDRLYYPANANIIQCTQLDACSPVLLRLAQEAGDRQLRDTALSDPRLGRLYRFGAGVKGSSAECMIAYGPYAYCYYDPSLKPRRRRISLPLSREFTRAHYGETALLRTRWDTDAVIACVSGYHGGGAHGFSDLHVQWEGKPVLRAISAEEAQPVSCGSLPCVGGQNEVVARLGRLESKRAYDRLEVQSVRLDHEYWLLRGERPVLVVALRRRPRGIRTGVDGETGYVRTNGRGALQYARRPHFSPDSGRLSMRMRLNDSIDPTRLQVLFNTGLGVGKLMGPQVNNFSLGFLKDRGLTFAVQSQRYTVVQVRVPPEKAAVVPGCWHDVAIAWGGFNDPTGAPFIEVELDGHRERCDDTALFGELGRDSQSLESRETPRTFHIKSTTLLGFGGAIQMPRTAVKCDIASIDLQCPGKEPLVLDFAEGVGAETGGGTLSWKLNPVDLKTIKRTKATLGAGSRRVEVLAAYPDDARLSQETVPFAPSGLAAGSLKRFVPDSETSSERILVSSMEDVLVMAFVDRRAKARVDRSADGFCIRVGDIRYGFQVSRRGKPILKRASP
ncbi:MAG: hypothetical protein QGI83_15645 [Candidatus Latescibacteria bacterium]|nr:hypothetical protein [Candidatus Latescibacterota bacterium]